MFGKLGHFTFALVALLTVNKFGIQAGMIAVAIADATVVFIVIICAAADKFHEDEAAGTEAREKGIAIDEAAKTAWEEEEKKLKDEIARLRNEVTTLREKLGIKPLVT